MNRTHSSLIPLTYLHTPATCVDRNSEKEVQCEATDRRATSAAARLIWILNTDFGCTERNNLIWDVVQRVENTSGGEGEGVENRDCVSVSGIGHLDFVHCSTITSTAQGLTQIFNYLNQSSNHYTYCRPCKWRAAFYPDNVWLSQQRTIISLNITKQVTKNSHSNHRQTQLHICV